MKVRRQFFKHFGSKGRVSAKMTPPRHKLIVEPFAGSAAYSTRHATENHDVLLIDSDERVCMVWDFLIGASSEDILALPVDHFLAGGDIRELNLTPERFYFIQRWLSISGTHSYRLAPCLLKDRGGETGNTWCVKRRAKIAAQVDQINHWRVMCASYSDAPDVEAEWVVDPPYQGNKHGFSEYKCAAPDYVELADWCRTRKGNVTVHEQTGADWLPFDPFMTIRTNRTKDGRALFSGEVVWKKECS